MRKHLLLIIAMFTILGVSLKAQNIVGGGGVVYTDSDPNSISALEDVSVNEAHIAYDTSAQVVYFFDQTGTAGVDQWVAVDVSSVVSSVVGAGDISVTNVGSVYTVSFTEALTTLAFNSGTNTLTYTDEDGNATNIDMTGAVDVNGSNSVTVTGDGDAASPYVIELAGAHTIGNAGTVPVTDGAGNLSWTNIVENVEVTAAGAIQLTFTDGTTALLDLDSAPKVANKTELDAAAAALPSSGDTGIAIAAATNTFGLPATSNVGVIFFIKKN